tara:strand:- start:132 stop:434 length:303 start_codon:yes stop_codon:yes gene_type:complete
LKNNKKSFNYNLLSTKEQPLSAHMESDGSIDLRQKAVSKYVKEQVRLFKENRKNSMRAREEVKRRNNELNFQKKMQRLEKDRQRINEEINRLNNSRVIDG